MYQNQIIHVIIGFKHDVSCIVRSEALRGHSDTSVAAPSCLRSHNARYIMLKSLSITTYKRLHNIEMICWSRKPISSFDIMVKIVHIKFMLNLCRYVNRRKWLLIKIKPALISLEIWLSLTFRLRIYVYAMNGCVSLYSGHGMIFVSHPGGFMHRTV